MSSEVWKVIKSVDRSWSKDHIIRYLYINLAYCFEQDPHYFLADPEEQFAQYKKGFNYDEKLVVCSTLVDYYIEAFAFFGIRAVKIQATNVRIPLFAMIVAGEKGTYYMSPINDLFRCQYGLNTDSFATIPHNSWFSKKYTGLVRLSEEDLRNLDRDLKIHQLGVSIADMFKELRKEMIVKSIACKHFGVDIDDSYNLTIRKLEFIKKELINLGCVRGICERNMMYGYIRGQILDKIEKAHTSVVYNFDEPFNIRTDFVVDYPDHDVEVYEDFCDSKGQFHLERIK